MAPPKARLGSRDLFPDLTVAAYLNHAAISPASAPTCEAVAQVTKDYARGGILAFPRWSARAQVCKRQFAELIGADSEEISFGWNTSRGLTDIALSVPWKPSDRVLVYSGEFPANVTPWRQAADHFGLELLFHVADDFATGVGLERLEAELKRGLRLVAVSAVQFQTGLRMPLSQMAALCHAHGAEICVDAIQACGAVPLNVRDDDIDYLVTGGHKWLLGFEGAGFIFIRKELSAKLRPLTAGWLSHENPVRFLREGAGHLHYDAPLRTTADVFETGTGPLLGLAALGASVPMLLELGVENIWRHVGKYHDLLEKGLLERGFYSLRAREPEARSCILSARPPLDVSGVKLNDALRAEGIITALPDGYLRFAPHFANAHSEVDLVLDALDDLLPKLAEA